MTLTEMRRELDEYWEVLLEREPYPIDEGVMTLMEVASVYYARASHMAYTIQRGQAQGHVDPKSPLARFRTGELRTFLDATKRLIDLGSRRVTFARMTHDMEAEAL